MTTIDSYHTQMVAPEQNLHATTDCGIAVGRTPEVLSKSVMKRHTLQRGEPIPVTPEEEEAWLDKMQRLAGCVA